LVLGSELILFQYFAKITGWIPLEVSLVRQRRTSPEDLGGAISNGMDKGNYTWIFVLLIGIGLIVFAYYNSSYRTYVDTFVNPTPMTSSDIIPTSMPSNGPDPVKTTVLPTPVITPQTTPDLTRTTYIDEKVPWELLPETASCQLQGEIKFIEQTIYDNQDAKFSYQGIDHPARLITWTVSPQDDPFTAIGPNIFSQMILPDGENLIGLVLPENPKYKRYELTAKINYGRIVGGVMQNGFLVGGSVKLFEKQCEGKTIVVLP
jgi:hypothetical protein